jgi:hypothetical protein
MASLLPYCRKHVLEDLRPYVCTFEGCLAPNPTFSTTYDLERHEKMAHHRSETYYECLIDDCHARYCDPVFLGVHQYRCHKIDLVFMAGGILEDSLSTERPRHTEPPALFLYLETGNTCVKNPLNDSSTKPTAAVHAFEECAKLQGPGLVCGLSKYQLDRTARFDSE